jgi:protein-disulfide isomerase
MLAGVVLLVAAVLAVAIAISSGGSSAPRVTGPSAKRTAAMVNSLLADIPQSGNTLGSPKAKVTITEFGDLKCPICRDFALGTENQLISSDVRSGNVKLVYRSLCTATCDGPQRGVFPAQQAAALAAGLQGKEWNYIELFYHLQGDESTSYVDGKYLTGLAKLVRGLDYSKWAFDSGQSSLKTEVTADENAASKKGFHSTPAVVVQGPKGQAQPLFGDYPYSDVEAAIKSVS